MPPMLKPGDKAYVVVEYDSPDDDSIHTWRVVELTIKAASERQITFEPLGRALTGSSFGFRRRFTPSMLGIMFHRTRESAVIHFVHRQRNVIASANRAIIEAARAMAWVRSLKLEGVSPEIEEQEAKRERKKRDLSEHNDVG
jgi:hypothetical protein